MANPKSKIASPMTLARSLLAIVALISLSAQSVHAEARWPRWRGPRGDGHSEEKRLPVRWDASNVVWKTALTGGGESSPIVWDGKIFLTTAANDGRRRSTLCLDSGDGSVLWEKAIDYTGELEQLHKLNTFASPTCATDGEVVVSFFGNAGLHAYTVDGRPLWNKALGTFDNIWGPAASPVIVDDLVIQNGDADSDAFLAAFDKRTGEEAWRVPRPNYRGWSTPVLIEAQGRRELVLNGHEGVAAYDPASGKLLWSCRGFAGRGEPTATPGDGLVYLVNGLAGDVYAVAPGGSGDVTSSRMQWHTPRKVGRDLPSPIFLNDCLVVASMGGVVVGYDAASGSQLWTDRLKGNFSASPIAAGGRAYFQAEDGAVVVIEAGPRLKLIARNTIDVDADEIFRASPAPTAGRLLLRSDRALYCIGSESADQ